MSLQIDRFEKKDVQRGMTLRADNDFAIAIKDHSIDKIIALVNLENSTKRNGELADLIITTIEEFILENENDSN